MTRVGFRWLERGSTRHPEIMTLSGGSARVTDFPALVGVIAHPLRGLFMFDTGYDPAFQEATNTFPERLYRWTTPAEIGPELEWRTWLKAHHIDEAQIVGTIISHFHGDHVAGLRHLADKPVYCARAGLNALRKPGRLSRVSQGMLARLVPECIDSAAHFFEDATERALPSAFAPFVSGRDILGDGSLIAVELPGHCPGHWGLALTTHVDQPVLLAADAAWSGRAIKDSRPPPRITTALLGETRSYRATLGRLHAVSQSNGDLAILPSHCARSARAFRGDHET